MTPLPPNIFLSVRDQFALRDLITAEINRLRHFTNTKRKQAYLTKLLGKVRP